MHVALNNHHTLTLSLSDKIRPEAPTVIQHLSANLNKTLTLLTGDTAPEANRVSRALSIPVLCSSQLPHNKATYITTLRSQGHTVAMLGDGLNDLPAQAAADIGIHFSTSLSTLSDSTTANSVIITSPNLSRLPELLEIARLTMRQANRNTAWAVVYNIVAVSLASGILERWVPGCRVDARGAAALMGGSSLGVLGWSLMLGRELREIEFRGCGGNGEGGKGELKGEVGGV